MGFFKRKEYTDEQNTEYLQQNNVPVARASNRPSKFSAFSQHANKLNSARPNFTAKPEPVTANLNSGNPYENANVGYNSGSGQSQNPYARAGNNSSNPDPYASYGQGQPVAADPYGGSSYSNKSAANSYGTASSNASYSSAPNSGYERAASSYANRFGASSTSKKPAEDEYARQELFKNVKPKVNPKQLSPDDELLAEPSELDRQSPAVNNDMGGAGEERTFVDSEDEEVEELKGQIRATKLESVQSTRNALEMAARAEESGRNALGMLGSQAERLGNTEQSISISEIQTEIAEEKAKELKRINRTIFRPNISFNSKRKIREREEQVKQRKQIEQQQREARRKVQYESEQRVMNGLTSQSHQIGQKYRLEASRAERSKYQFEADSEDEALEDEIDTNLHELSAAAGRLKQLALTTRDEVTDQNKRIDKIAARADDLEIDVHLNTNRLANIR